MVDNEEIDLIAEAVARKLSKQIYNMFYSWSMFIDSEDGTTPSYEEAISD